MVHSAASTFEGKVPLMHIKETGIPGLLLLEPRVHRDARGFFLETWREDWASLIKAPAPFIQDNHARSETKGVLRGLHYQSPPHAQSKLVWVTRGAVYDVAVDLRASSPTFGSWFGVELTAQNFLRLYVPRGFAHGYLTLEAGTEFHYKVDAYYAPEHDCGIAWNDPDLGISWPEASLILSEKDAALPRLSGITTPFS